MRLALSPYDHSIQAGRGLGPKPLGLRLIRAVLGVATKEIQKNLVDVMEGTSLGAQVDLQYRCGIRDVPLTDAASILHALRAPATEFV